MLSVRKKPDPKLAKFPPPKLEDPIEEHVRYAYEAIYKDPYPDDSLPLKKAKKREHHGIPHAARVAINTLAFANLYRRHGDQGALALTNDDLKLIQIAAIFHDCARKGDGADEWDKQSAWSLYLYLTEGLKVDADKARLLAEAIANKDADSSYFKLELTPDNIRGSKQNGTRSSTHRWVEMKNVKNKNIYQKLIHDADCLDIIRARDCFEGENLDFYKEIAIHKNNAFNEMAKLISEGKSLIERHGDSRDRIKANIKCKYENGDAYQSMMHDIQSHKTGYKMYNALLADNTLLTGEALTQQILPDYSTYEYKEINAETLTAAMTNGDLFARAIGAPAATATVRQKDYATAATIEVKKITRDKGNPNRSGSIILPGSSVYAGVGFLTVKPDFKDIISISQKDADTGRGKKAHLKPTGMSHEEKEKQKTAVVRREKMGGSAKQYPHSQHAHTQNETVMTIKRVDAIFFSQDATMFNLLTTGEYYPPNSQTQYLQALHLQMKYFAKTGKKLPIFEYSGVHGYIKETPDYTDDEIEKMWVDMVSNLIKNKLKENNTLEDSMESLLIEAIYGNVFVYKMGLIRKKFVPNSHYTPELKHRISVALENAKTKCLDEHKRNMQVISDINAGTLSVLSEDAFKIFMEYPHLIDQVGDKIIKESRKFFLSASNNLERTEKFSAVSNHRYSELTKENYFNTVMARVCFYAAALDPELITIIKSIATKLIKTNLNLIKKMLNNKDHINNNTLIETLMGLIDYAIRADLLDKNKEIIDAINNTINYIYINNDVANFKSIVLYIHKAGLLEGAVLVNCLQKIEKFKVDSKNTDLIRELEMNISDKTDKLIAYSNNLKQKISDNVKKETIKTRKPMPKLPVSLPSQSRDALFNRKRASTPETVLNVDSPSLKKSPRLDDALRNRKRMPESESGFEDARKPRKSPRV